MRYIYLDESGDLGLNFDNRETSRYFVITLLLVNKKRPIEKIVKSVFSGFTRIVRKKHNGVLHAHKERDATRKRVLTKLVEKDIKILSIYLNKQKVYEKLHGKKHELYNYVAQILFDRICNNKIIPADEPITLVAARRETNKYLNENFPGYLADQTKQKHDLDLRIEIKTSSQEKCLQLADMVCWTIFRKREHGDRSYYDIIEGKIFEESPLYP